jgi:hypothetical protein
MILGIRMGLVGSVRSGMGSGIASMRVRLLAGSVICVCRTPFGIKIGPSVCLSEISARSSARSIILMGLGIPVGIARSV